MNGDPYRLPIVVISDLALDRASLLCRYFWHEDRARSGLGILSWLRRQAAEALKLGQNGKVWTTIYKGMKFKFSDGQPVPGVPVLISIRPAKRQHGVDSVKRKVHDLAPDKSGPVLEGPVGAKE